MDIQPFQLIIRLSGDISPMKDFPGWILESKIDFCAALEDEFLLQFCSRQIRTCLGDSTQSASTSYKEKDTEHHNHEQSLLVHPSPFATSLDPDSSPRYF